MTRISRRFAVVSLIVLCLGCSVGEDKTPPSITAQGFDLEQRHEARAGTFSSVRLRFEVPAGIEHLVVSERSYEIDLAESTEASQYPLFGIERRVWSKQDVTLDFSGYLNEKIRIPGEYVLRVEVADRDARKTSARLLIEVPDPEAVEESDASTEAEKRANVEIDESNPGESVGKTDRAIESVQSREERPFRLQRVGVGPVEGGDRFGVTWKTVGEIEVVIRMGTPDGRPGRIVRLDPLLYDELATSNDLGRDLNRILSDLEPTDAAEIPTANNAARGALIAVVRPDERFLLRTERSSTSLSELGTTVTLSGRYRD